MGINRLRKVGTHQIEALAIISEESMKPLCDKYGIEYCFYKNEPLGEKKNYGLSVALKKDFDYLVEIGSDDVLKNDFLNLYTWDKPILNLGDFILLNSKNGECRMVTATVPKFGAGRAISKEALMSGKIWHDKASRGMDNRLLLTLAPRGFMAKCFNSEPMAIDIKSDVNIWKYKKQGKKYPVEKALSGLSEQEKNAIHALA